jgi:hypothetical protein
MLAMATRKELVRKIILSKIEQAKHQSQEKSKARSAQRPSAAIALVLMVSLFIVATSLISARSRMLIEHQTSTQALPSVQPTSLPTSRPTSTPLPTAKVKQSPDILPSAAPPQVVAPQKQLVNCLYDEKCGGTKGTTKEECNATLCCSIGGEHKISSVGDCYAEQNRLLEEAYKQALNESNKAAEEENRKLIESLNLQATTLEEQRAAIEETNQKLLEACRQNVKEKYPQIMYGQIVGETPERRNARTQANEECFNRYGT